MTEREREREMDERGRYNRLERERLNGKRIRDRREERKIKIGRER